MKTAAPFRTTPGRLARFAWLLPVAGLVLAALNLSGQPRLSGRASNYSIPSIDADGRRTSVVRGDEVVPTGDGLLKLTGTTIELLKTGEERDLIIKAPHALYDTASDVAYSDSSISMRTADGQFSIEGAGFRWNPEQTALIISNNVRAIVQRRAEDAAAPQPLELTSERLRYSEGIAVFSGNVRVDDPELGLHTAMLTLERDDAGRIARILGEGGVILENKADGSRATGDSVLYTESNGAEVVELFGHAEWTDGERYARSTRFILDRGEKLLTALGEGYFRLPRQGGPEGALFIGAPAPAPNPAPAPGENATNEFIEVFSEFMRLALPETNGPVRGMIARTNVVIQFGPDGRATGEHADYDSDLGVLQLTGNPSARSGEQIVRGDVLEMNLTNRVFRAGPNAFLRLPLGEVIKEIQGDGATQPVSTTASRFVELLSTTMEYDGALLTFHGPVHGLLSEHGEPRGQLRAGELRIRYSNQVERASADGGVHVTLFPASDGDGRQGTLQEIVADRAEAEFDASGRLSNARMLGGVTAIQTEPIPDSSETRITRVTAPEAHATFKGTNQIDVLRLEGGVNLDQGDRSARGDWAKYSGDDQLWHLGGEPVARFPEGEISRAELLIWDPERRQFRTRGLVKSRWRRTPGLDAELGSTRN